MKANLKKALAVSAMLAITGLAGCSYAGIATAPDGTLYVTRNDEGLFSFGSNRAIFICKPSGEQLNCHAAPDRP